MHAVTPQIDFLFFFIQSGTTMCGTNHGSSVQIYQMVMMDGRCMMLHHKRQVKVRQ